LSAPIGSNCPEEPHLGLLYMFSSSGPVSSIEEQFLASKPGLSIAVGGFMPALALS